MTEPVLYEPKPLVRLDLASGQTPRDGFQAVDLCAPNTQHVDLRRYPWPWADASVDEVHCSHYVEHIPCDEVREGPRQGQDALFAFFDELHRILKPGANATIIVPCGRSSRGFQDPTHRRFIMAETFLYLSAEWRAMNKLDHYGVTCDFGVAVLPIVQQEMTLLHPEAAARRFSESWNVIHDWQANLTKK